MRKTTLLILMIVLYLCTAAQDNTLVSAIKEEGKLLYRLEVAAWNGTEIFLKDFSHIASKLKGYFAYEDKEYTRVVFFSNDAVPNVIATFSFDSTFDPNTVKREDAVRAFTEYEKQIHQLRNNALEAINRDTTFKTYKNTNLNLIPIISNNERKVYVLTGPQVTGVVIFGNDYLLTYDEHNQLQHVKQLHRNILPLKYGDQESKAIASVHSHTPETGDYITSTDICTLMLYEKFAGWEQHMVVSDKFVSVWSCRKNDLLVLTREAWEKIYNGK
jgi:hypothetical protein